MSIRVVAVIVVLAAVTGFASAGVNNGRISAAAQDLAPGSAIDLTGTWMFKPTFMLKPDERPEASVTADGYFPVAVPQFLCETRAWLDDSEDFKKFDAARLAKLGFDHAASDEGWYRLDIHVPELPGQRRVFIEFEGVAMRCRAYLNGKELGSHEGMFSRFSFDLKPHLKPGANVLALWVSMEKIPVSTMSMGQAVSVNLTASKVKTMSKGMFGPLVPDQDNRAYDLYGIWQPVKLVARDGAMLKDVWFKPALNSAEVIIEAVGLEEQKATVHVTWKKPSDQKLLAKADGAEIALSSIVTSTSLSVQEISPELWTPANPALYAMEVQLRSPDGRVLDSYTANVGFRTFEARDKQLYLNGKPYWLRGSNHLPYGKNPWQPGLARKLIQLMHDANQRVTRTHCIPWNEEWLRAADEIGLGVSIEGPRPWAFAGDVGATPPDLFKHWLMENEDIIRRCRNHPSVLIYTVGNEMLLRDHKNREKWQQLSDVTKQMRQLDPTRPVIGSSSYIRDPKLYKEMIEPNSLDDGDIDDAHSYKAWYGESPFVEEALTAKERGANRWQRPFIGQEMSTGYPDLDTGLPTLRYTRDVITPQAWVGEYSYPGSDPKWFLEYHRIVTKRWAEKLRFERREKETAGFMMFAAECWFRHSYDAETVKPYPVVEAMKQAWAPVGIALGSEKRRFYGGTTESVSIYITNDSDDFQDLIDAELKLTFTDESGGTVLGEQYFGVLEPLGYYETRKIDTVITIPQPPPLAAFEPGARTRAKRTLSIIRQGKVISQSDDSIDIFAQPRRGVFKRRTTIRPVELGSDLKSFFSRLGYETRTTPHSIIMGTAALLDRFTTGSELRTAVEDGATAIVFSPGGRIVKMFPGDVVSSHSVVGEFADWTPALGTSLVKGLEPMDLKWWGRRDDWRVFVAKQSHRLNPNGAARELIRFVPSHGYIRPEKRMDQFQSVFFEIPLGKGRLWVCDLDLENSVNVDPVAELFAENLLEAAADPNSTADVKPLPIRFE